MSLPSLQGMVNRVALTDHDLLPAGHYCAGFQVQPKTLLHIQDHLVYNLHSACVIQEMWSIFIQLEEELCTDKTKIYPKFNL